MALLFQKCTYILLFLTILTVPFQKSFIIPGIGSLNKLIGIALVVFAVFTVLLQKEFKRLSIFYITFLMFIVINIASYFWAEVPAEALGKSFLFIQLGFIAWAIYEFAGTNKKVNNLLKAYVLGCTFIALQSIYQFIIGNDQINETTRFFVEGYNPNALGVLWVLALPMSIYLIINGYKRYSLYIPIGIYVVFLTGSRTAFLILLYVAICSIWLLFKYRINYRKTYTLLLIVMGFIVYSQIPQGQLDRISTIDEEFSGGSLNGRTDIWSYGLEAFSNSPIFGVGSGSFLEASNQYSTTGVGMSAHNSYLSILVENGVIGFLLFFGMITVLIITSYKIDEKNPVRWLNLTLISAWLILSFASHAEAQKYTWIIFGLIITFHHLSKSEEEIISEKPLN